MTSAHLESTTLKRKDEATATIYGIYLSYSLSTTLGAKRF